MRQIRELILGGVRSGKSRRAEQEAQASGCPVVVIATAQAGDAEMARRIALHRRQRPSEWQTLEVPVALADCLNKWSGHGHCIVVDCLTLWLTNLLMQYDDAAIAQACSDLRHAVAGFRGRLLLVSNETNLGIVPADALTRRFCDHAGRLHQDLAGCCERVVLMVAGMPVRVKGES